MNAVKGWPEWANWKSIDRDGGVKFWDKKPVRHNGYWLCDDVLDMMWSSDDRELLNQYQVDNWPSGMLTERPKAKEEDFYGMDLVETEAMKKAKLTTKDAPAFLSEAIKVMQQRGKQYDSNEQERSMGKTVEAFNIITGKQLTESEGWLLLQLLKDVRQWSKPEYHEDSALDCIAYSALKAESLNQGK
jgi:hypothetical protein